MNRKANCIHKVLISTETNVMVGGKPVDEIIHLTVRALEVALIEQSLIREQYNLPDCTFEESELHINQLLAVLKY